MFTLTPEHQRLFKEIRELFESTKEIIQRVEKDSETDLTVILARYQLMYAGFHLARAVEKIEIVDEYDRQITEVRSHCRKAANYAYQEGIREFLLKIKLFMKSTGADSSLPDLIKDFADRKRQIQSAIKFINEGDVSTCDTQEYKKHYDQIFDTLDLFTANHDSLQAKEKEKIRKNRLTIIGASGAAIGGFATLFGLLYKPESNKNIPTPAVISPASDSSSKVIEKIK